MRQVLTFLLVWNKSRQVVRMPKNADVIDVYAREGRLCLLAVGDSAAAMQERVVHLLAPNRAVPAAIGPPEYVGTVLSPSLQAFQVFCQKPCIFAKSDHEQKKQ